VNDPNPKRESQILAGLPTERIRALQQRGTPPGIAREAASLHQRERSSLMNYRGKAKKMTVKRVVSSLIGVVKLLGGVLGCALVGCWGVFGAEYVVGGRLFGLWASTQLGVPWALKNARVLPWGRGTGERGRGISLLQRTPGYLESRKEGEALKGGARGEELQGTISILRPGEKRYRETDNMERSFG